MKASGQQLGASSRFYMHKAAHIAAINEAYYSVHLREEGVVFAATDVLAGFETCATLAHDDRATADQLSAECFYSKPLCI